MSDKREAQQAEGALYCWQETFETFEDLERLPGPCLGGGFEPAPNWDEYLDCYRQEWRPYLVAARLWLEAQDELPRASDWPAQHYLKFSDGLNMFFTWRGFGDFLQAVADKREGYLAYY